MELRTIQKSGLLKTWESTLFSCLGYGAFCKGKIFSEISNLSNLVEIQRYHENGK